MYQLKRLPEDFIVRERSSIQFPGTVQDTGKYLYFRLQKKNLNTLEAIALLARVLHVPEKKIGFAGSKDKTALTEQVCSIIGISPERLLALSLSNITLSVLGYGDEPITLGNLAGNEFEITVRNLTKPVPTSLRLSSCPNYFDEQRFSKNNVAIGKHLIKKEFAAACQLIDNSRPVHYLAVHPNDYVGALKQQPLRLLRLYVNAFQSYLWNGLLADYFQTHAKVIGTVPYSLGEFIFVADEEPFQHVQVPIPGFSGEQLFAHTPFQQTVLDLLQKESMTWADFIIKQIPELTLEGELRPAIVAVSEFTAHAPEDDELNPGKLKQKFSFFLGKGSYATIVMRKVLHQR